MGEQREPERRRGESRPGLATPRSDKEYRERELRRLELEPRVGSGELAYRFEHGLDLWTGRALLGRDAEDWLRLQFAMQEGDRDRDDDEDAA